MNIEEKTRLAEAWSAAHEIYDKSLTDGALMLVVQALDRYELADVLRALTEHVNDPASGIYTPKPADVVKRLDGDGASSGLRAWTRAITAASSVGGDRSVCFDDELIMRVVDDMGGWIKLCDSPLDEHGYLRTEFDRRYRGYQIKRPGTWPAKLTGRIEVHNAEQWPQCVPPLLLIGDKARARLVHERGGEGGAAGLKRINYDNAVEALDRTMVAITTSSKT